MNAHIYCAVIVLLTATVVACQSPSRYSQVKDSAPNYEYAEPDMDDVVPAYEPYRSLNNRPYEILGKRYYPMTTGKGYEASGGASWYGQKFHGHLTSNGETYNMFAMTAAHKTLPLPSFVKVTNLQNDKTAIVRVNDRGPFHSNRIIDLSYAAAKKLGFHKQGTTEVKLEVIYVDENKQVTVGSQPTISYNEFLGVKEEPIQTKKQSLSAGTYIQVAALSDLERAREVSTVLSELYQVPADTPFIDNIYKLRLGPMQDMFKAKMLLDDLKKNGYPGAYTVTVEQTE